MLLIGSAVVLWFAALRVGQNAPTSYGAERTTFEENWGGSIEQPLPEFWLMYDALSRRNVVPTRTTVDITLDHGTRRQGWLDFQAYTLTQTARFDVTNPDEAPGRLWLRLDRPGASALVYDYTVAVGGVPVAGPRLGDAMDLGIDLEPGATVPIAMTLSTNGTDRYALLLSQWRGALVPNFTATLHVDTDQFALLRYGLPHTRTNEGGRSTVVFDVHEFSAEQDVGVQFVTGSQDFDRVHELLQQSPAAVALLLLGSFVWSQVRQKRVPPLRWAYLVMVHCFYFLFLGYLVRYLSLGPAVAVSLFLSLGSFAVTVPAAVGYRLAWRTLFPILLALTAGYTALYLIPVFKGIAVLSFFFAGFMAIVAPLARADVGKWPAWCDDDDDLGVPEGEAPRPAAPAAGAGAPRTGGQSIATTSAPTHA